MAQPNPTLAQLVQLPENCYRVSAKAYIQDDRGKVLVVKEGDDYWDLPGGGVEHLELFEESLRREVREEAGLDVIVGSLREVIKFRSMSGIEAIFIIYNCKLASSASPILGDASEFSWKRPGKITTRPFTLMQESNG